MAAAAQFTTRSAAPESSHAVAALPIDPHGPQVPGPVVQALKEPGRPLHAAVARSAAPGLRLRPDTVRVHEGHAAASSAAALGARAYAYGQHLVFGAGAYAPNTPGGRRLIAHELAHVVQQARSGRAQLARQLASGVVPRPELPGEVVTIPHDGLVQRQGPGYLRLQIAGRDWVRLEWDPSYPEPPSVEIATRLNGDPGDPTAMSLGVRVRANFELVARVDRSIESISSGPFYRLYSYDLQCPGRVEVITGTTPAGTPIPGGGEQRMPWRVRELYPPTRNRELGELMLPLPSLAPPSAESLDPLADEATPRSGPEALQSATEATRHEDMIRGHPAFDTREAMEAFIREHPDEAFVGISTSYGRFVARRVDEAELQRLATAVREDRDSLPELAWGAEERRSAWGVTGVYQQGRVTAQNDFAHQWFGEDFFAGIGHEEEFEEAEVFRMGSRSFGRRPLDHTQALARWDVLSAMASSDVRTLHTEPGHRFYALWVRGAGRVHEIGESYFAGRDAFFSEIAPMRAELLQTFNAMSGSANSSDIGAFLMAELDRETPAARLRTALSAHAPLAEAVSQRVYGEVEDRAQRIMLQRLEAGRRQIDAFATDAERMRTFVLGLPEMTASQRDEAMAFIGVPTDERRYVVGMLATPEAAMRVALGLTEEHTEEEQETIVADNAPAAGSIIVTHTYRVSIEQLMQWAAATVAGFDDAMSQLRDGSTKALRLEGELGNAVRREVYQEFGFHLLDPTRFPHAEETTGWFPDPLQAGTMPFTSQAEQMFANRVRHMASEDTVWHVLRVSAMVLAAIAMVLVAQELGAVAAGLMFTEGSAAFVATELVVSGLAFTAMAEMQTRLLEGRWSNPSDIALHGALNIATFGAFRYLNTLLAAGARSFVTGRVGGSAAFEASRGAQRAAEALRITGVGATFLVAGIGARLAQGQHFESWGEFALFAYENLLTLALLEGGAVLARPLMMRGSIWARENRLGAFESEITALRGDAARLQRDLASLSVRPQAAERDAPAMAERARTALEAQRDLCARLREGFRTRGDAAALEAQAGAELQHIDSALAGIRQAEFLMRQRVTPIEGSESVFSYTGGADAVERFRAFYGTERVRAAEDGTLRVEVPGLESGELVFVPVESLAPAAGSSAPAVPDVVQRQLALEARQRSLLSRARRLGVTDPSLNAISAARLRVSQRTRPEALDAAERLIATAEREAGARMDAQTRTVLGNVRTRLGPRAIDQIRAGELSGVSDAELADVLWQARGLQDMGVAQLRALVFAARPGEPAIDFPKLLQTMRRGRFGVAARNFALETFTQMMERRLPGARDTLADMAVSSGRFRGGLFEMEAIRYLGGLERVRGTQVRRSVGTRAREYDIELTDGSRVECKDWWSWEYADDSLGDPFERDVASLTEGFSNPVGIRRMRYLFRSPPPRSVAEIRSFLRQRLSNALTRASASEAIRDAMLREFDDFTLLVEAPDLQRSGGLPLADPSIAPPSPALDEDDDRER